MNRTNIYQAISLLLAGVVIGLVIGRGQRPETDGPTQPNKATAGTNAVPIALTDLAAALESFQRTNKTEFTQLAIYQLADGVATNDVPKALEQVTRLQDLRQQDAFRQRLVLRWANWDTAAALQYSLALPPGNQRAMVAGQVLQVWARREPKAVMDWAVAFPEPGLQSAALTYAMPELAKQDPEAALSFVDKHYPVAQQAMERQRVISAWGELEPEKAMRRWIEIGVPQDRDTFTRVLLQKWVEKDPATMVAWLLAQPANEWRSGVIRDVIAKLAIKDSAGAITLVESMPQDYRRESAVTTMFSAWANADLPGLQNWVKAQPAGGSYNAAAVQAICLTLANSDVRKAAQYLDELPMEMVTAQAAQQVAYQWSRVAPAQALEWAQKLKTPETRETVIGHVLRFRAEKAPAEASRQAAALLSGRMQTQTLQSTIPFWFMQDGLAAAGFIATLPDEDLRRTLLSRGIPDWAERDPAAATKWLLQQPADATRRMIEQSLVSGLSRQDPELAAKFLEQLPVTSENIRQLGNVAERWAATNAVKTFDWVSKLPAEARDQVARNALRSASSKEPTVAAKFIDLMDKDSRNGGIVNEVDMVVRNWAEKDPLAAHAWLKGITLKDSYSENRIYSQLLRSWAQKDPQTACEKAVETGKPGELVSKLQAPLQVWTQKNASAAANWVLKLPNEADRSLAIGTVARDWRRNDATAFTKWAQQLPPGSDRDVAWREAVRGFTYNDPEKAAQLVKEIQGTVARHMEMEQIARRWLQVAPGPAKQWIEAGELPARIKEQLLKPNSGR